MRLSSMNSGTAFSADRNSIQPTCRSAVAQSFPSDTTISDSEFPSLGVRQSASPYAPLPTTSFSSSPVPHSHLYQKDVFSAVQQSRTPYASLMRPNDGSPALTNNSEFHMQSEDFPALPGSNPTDQIAYNNGQSSSGQNSTEPSERPVGRAPTLEVKTGIKTLPDGTVTNIPPTMLADQFGMAGLLTFLRAIDSDRSIIALALGNDLTNLGLNIHSSDKNLYTAFGGPWADHSCRVQDLEAKVPEEYITNPMIRDKLPPIKLGKFSEDVLFYLFYNYPKEMYQLAAANELYTRDWRFHKTEQMWLTRSPYGGVKEHTSTYEKGSYNVFDPHQWRKIPKDMTLEYKLLEDRPKMPTDWTNPGISRSAMANMQPHMIQHQHQGFFPGQPHMHAQQNSGAGAPFNPMAAVHHHGSGMHPSSNNGSAL